MICSSVWTDNSGIILRCSNYWTSLTGYWASGLRSIRHRSKLLLHHLALVESLIFRHFLLHELLHNTTVKIFAFFAFNKVQALRVVVQRVDRLALSCRILFILTESCTWFLSYRIVRQSCLFTFFYCISGDSGTLAVIIACNLSLLFTNYRHFINYEDSCQFCSRILQSLKLGVQ